ncbi:MAG: glutamate/tyrosine decarboxylase-like PLP-dependent enzyme [Acidimicrobiales bacterium]|jgi:glutamate/tyrosine decarboxylase-like PLP-dependent enzyme
MHAEHDWNVVFKGLQELIAHETAVPVRGPRAPSDLSAELSLELGDQGIPLQDVVAELVQIGKATPATAPSQFFNQLFGGRIEAATIAEMFSAFLNTSMYTYKVAGPQVLIERTLIERMCKLAGFETGDGSFTPGGSLSNMLAMVVAREEHFPERDDGGPPSRHAIAYTSDLGHYSVRKNAMLTGVGRRNLRLLATTPDGRMDPRAFSEQIERDLADGYQPFFVNVTAGTTVLGAFDPLVELTSIARQYGLWVHVDGALGGSMLLSDRHRDLLEGLEKVDSFTWDAHKLMGVPLTSSVCLFRGRGLLETHLAEVADYLFQADDRSLDPGLTSLQCGRRNDALKVWAAWKYLGDDGYAARIENVMEMATYLASQVEQTPGLRLIRQPVSINVCFTVDGIDAATMCQALHESERALVGFASVDGEPVIRLAVAAPTTREALDAFLASVAKTAYELRSSDKETCGI